MKDKRKTILVSVLGAMIISVAAIVFYYVYEGLNYVKTEDSKVTGDIVRVNPKIVGELHEFNVEEGDYLEKEQVVGL